VACKTARGYGVEGCCGGFTISNNTVGGCAGNTKGLLHASNTTRVASWHALYHVSAFSACAVTEEGGAAATFSGTILYGAAVREDGGAARCFGGRAVYLTF